MNAYGVEYNIQKPRARIQNLSGKQERQENRRKKDLLLRISRMYTNSPRVGVSGLQRGENYHFGGQKCQKMPKNGHFVPKEAIFSVSGSQPRSGGVVLLRHKKQAGPWADLLGFRLLEFVIR